MAKLTEAEISQLSSLERRVEFALEAALKAPEALRELLVDAISRLRALESGSDERPDAVESVERTLAALEAWQRWRPSNQPSA